MATSVVKNRPGPVEQQPGPIVTVTPNFPTPGFPDFPNQIPTPKDTLDKAAISGLFKKNYSSLSGSRQATCAAEGNVIRVTLGTDRIGGDLMDAFVHDDKLVLMYGWGEGIYLTISNFTLGEKPFFGTVRHYTGSQSDPVDPTMAAARGWTENPGLDAFSIVEIAANDPVESLEAAAVIKGKRFIRRSTANGGSLGHSENPSELLGWLLERFYGSRPLQADLDACADYNDEVLATLSGDEKQDRGKYRARVGITFDSITDKQSIIETMQDYASVFLAWDGNQIRMIPNKPGTSVATIPANSVIKGSSQKWHESNGRVPNVIKLVYTERTNNTSGWTDQTYTTPYPTSGPVREQLARFPAIQSRAFASRKAFERLNAYNVTNLRGRFRTRDEGIKHLIGDIVTFNDQDGTTNKDIRILKSEVRGKGEWAFDWIEYDPAAHVNDYIAEPTAPDSELPDPTIIPDGPTPTLTEELHTDVATMSRFKVTFTGADWPFIDGYRVRVDGEQNVLEAIKAHEGEGVEHTIYTSALKQGVNYKASVWIKSVLGNFYSAVPGVATKIAVGKLLPPGDVLSATFFEAGSLVSGQWEAAEEIAGDLVGYTIKRLPAADYTGTSADWTHANTRLITERLDALSILTPSQPQGEYYYGIKAIDRAGNESVNALWKFVNVTTDAWSTNAADLDVGTTINMHVYVLDGDAKYAITCQKTAGVARSWTDVYISGTWLDNHAADDRFLIDEAPTASEFETEVWDSGASRGGDWSFVDENVTFFQGTQRNAILLAPDGAPGTFTEHVGLSVQATARYFKAKVSIDGTLVAGDSFLVEIPIEAAQSGEVLPQSGVVVIGGGDPNPATVTFTTAYFDPPRVTLTAYGSVALIPTADNITTTGFDLYLFDTTGTLVPGTVAWDAKGR